MKLKTRIFSTVALSAFIILLLGFATTHAEKTTPGDNTKIPESIMTTVQAQENKNLFKTAGMKQTNKDFKPAPMSIETNFGHLNFTGGGFPVGATAQTSL